MFSSPFLLRVCLLALGMSLAAGGTAPAQVPAAPHPPDAPPRQILLFDRGWRFHLGEAAGVEQAGFDDGSWRALDLPHDWMIEGVPGADPSKMEGPFDPNSPAGAAGGYLNGGVGWYRKRFTVPAVARGKRVSILFDGAYMDADVYLNGRKLGNHPYGFTSFSFDLTSGLKFGADANVLAVRLNVEQPSCRWYSGAGLYRHVWLVETQPLHVAQWGTTVTTPQATAAGARVQVRTELVNDGSAVAAAVLTTILVDPDGHEVARQEQRGTVVPGSPSALEQSFSLERARLWSPDTPVLYQAVSEVRLDGALVDSCTTPFGVRTVEFTADRDMLLNGQPLAIRGVCDHHDLGCLGAVALRRGFQRQLEILKTMGCNALRTSHNPPSPELLDLCDQMGFLVMDEFFDEWKTNKTKKGYGRFFDAWAEKDLVSMLRRDRNHPSIVLWSIGNEIPESGTAEGPKIGQFLVDICHREDPTRAVTAACHLPLPAVKFGFDKVLDVFGINYNYETYNNPLLHGPDKLLASETASTVDSRGDYGLSIGEQGEVVIQTSPNPKTNQVTAFDHPVPGWVSSSEVEEGNLRRAPWVAGEFVWTGFDYIGEPSPYAWPSRSSYFGAIDLCGFPKDRYYMYRSQWTREPIVHIMPHWTWPGFEGKAIPVWVYSNAEAVELFANGKSLGIKHPGADAEIVHRYKKDKKTVVTTVDGQPVTTTREEVVPINQSASVHLAWSVPYAPGELKAVATTGGQIVATETVRTAGAPAKLRLQTDRAQLAGDGQDLAFLTVTVLDRDGNVCPDADNEIRFQLAGDAAGIAGVDNGDATNHEQFQGTQHRAYHGLALAVLRSRAAGNGPVTLTASADGLQPASATVAVAAK